MFIKVNIGLLKLFRTQEYFCSSTPLIDHTHGRERNVQVGTISLDYERREECIIFIFICFYVCTHIFGQID